MYEPSVEDLRALCDEVADAIAPVGEETVFIFTEAELLAFVALVLKRVAG